MFFAKIDPYLLLKPPVPLRPIKLYRVFSDNISGRDMFEVVFILEVFRDCPFSCAVFSHQAYDHAYVHWGSIAKQYLICKNPW